MDGSTEEPFQWGGHSTSVIRRLMSYVLQSVQCDQYDHRVGDIAPNPLSYLVPKGLQFRTLCLSSTPMQLATYAEAGLLLVGPRISFARHATQPHQCVKDVRQPWKPFSRKHLSTMDSGIQYLITVLSKTLKY
jgi:hypothetical protein